jgi:hypothetical protein
MESKAFPRQLPLLHYFPLKPVKDRRSVRREGFTLDDRTRDRMQLLVRRVEQARTQLATETAALKHFMREVGRDGVIGHD